MNVHCILYSNINAQNNSRYIRHEIVINCLTKDSEIHFLLKSNSSSNLLRLFIDFDLNKNRITLLESKRSLIEILQTDYLLYHGQQHRCSMYLRTSMGSLHPHEKFESEKRLRLAIRTCIDICLEVILSRLVMLLISRKVFSVYLSFMSG